METPSENHKYSGQCQWEKSRYNKINEIYSKRKGIFKQIKLFKDAFFIVVVSNACQSAYFINYSRLRYLERIRSEPKKNIALCIAHNIIEALEIKCISETKPFTPESKLIELNNV